MEKYKLLFKNAEQPLSDNEYLEKLIVCNYRFSGHEMWQMKDTNSICMAISPAFANLLGFKKAEEMVGRKDYEVPCKVAEVADVFYKQDREVKQSGNSKHFLDIHEYFTGTSVLKSKKAPIINPYTNNILGNLWQGAEFTINTTLKTILDLHGNNFGMHSSLNVTDIENNFKLTNIELEVLFCLCLGFSHKKSIAGFLSFIYKQDINTDTTVNDAFRRLYRKTSCNSKSQLLEFAVANNLHLQIPKSFLISGSFEI